MIEKLKEKLNIENMRLVSAIYLKTSKSCTFTFLVDEKFGDDDKKKCEEIIATEFFENSIIKFKRSILDEEVIAIKLKAIIKEKFSTLYELINFYNNLKVLLSDEVVIEITLNEELLGLFELSNANAQIKTILEEEFFSSFNIILKKEDFIVDEELILRREKEFLEKGISEFNEQKKYVKVIASQNLIGENESKRATAISEIIKEMQGVNICGKISFLTKRSFNKEKKGEKITKYFYTFSLSDGTGRMQCSYFPSKANLPKMEKVSDDTKVLLFGDVEIYNDRLSFKPKTVSYVEDYRVVEPEKVVIDACNLDYKCIKPKAYEDYKQFNLLSAPEPVLDIMKENSYVVFDLETTGLNPSLDAIIEIGAVKVVNGDIVEEFSTLINPEREIPYKATAVNNITNDMVKNAPKINEVIGDFLKFCEGSIMVAYNLEFDMSFIKIASARYNYSLNNKSLDAMAVARESRLKISNHKLKTVLAALSIDNKNAHRAVSDAVATAKMLLKLAKFIKV